MDFGLIGDHPAGLALARALGQRPGFVLAAYAGPAAGLNCTRLNDVESLLALRSLELVIVAEELAYRADTLRRTLQSDKHAICIHPLDLLPDLTYEAAMIQQETRKLLLPMLPQLLAPAVLELKRVLTSGQLGSLQLIEWQQTFVPHVAAGLRPAAKPEAEAWEAHPLVSLWAVLRLLGGEIRDVTGIGTEPEVLRPDEPLTVTGHFETGGLLRVLLTPGSSNSEPRLLVQGANGEAVRTLAEQDAGSALAEELARQLAGERPRMTWLDATRCLELHEAVRSSARRRRTVPMNYEEFTEASSFRGVMTAWGCGVLVLVVIALISLLAFKVPLKPAFLYVLLPLLVLFLGLQVLRWIVPREEGKPADSVKRTDLIEQPEPSPQRSRE
jgi:predicted dehydrogenase